jgi:hypothetical protein
MAKKKATFQNLDDLAKRMAQRWRARTRFELDMRSALATLQAGQENLQTDVLEAMQHAAHTNGEVAKSKATSFIGRASRPRSASYWSCSSQFWAGRWCSSIR